MTFKEKIVKLRKQKGLTQDEFASAVGVSRQAVYKWESGHSYPEAQKLLEIKKLFDISIDDLLDENYEIVLPEKKKKKRLSKEVKAELEAEALGETPIAEAPAAEAAATEPAIEEVKVEAAAEVVEEAPAAPEATPEAAPAAEEAVAPAVEEAPVAPVAEESAEAPAEEKAEEKAEASLEEGKKKVGFFGRIFGRK